MLLWGGVYIRCCGNGHLGFRPYGGSLLKSPEAGPVESNQNASAHHSVPRLGSACLNEGIAPWAAAKGHPWASVV